MSSKFKGKSANRPDITRAALDPEQSTVHSKMELVSKTLFAPFNNKKKDSSRILTDLAPVIMTPRMINAAATVSSRSQSSLGASAPGGSRLDFATLGRAPMRLTLGTRRITSRDLQIIEATDELLDAEIPEAGGIASDVSLLRGFNATVPSSEKNRTRRKQMRNVETPRIGLKKLGMSARGMMIEDEEERSIASEEDMVVVSRLDERGKRKGKRRGRESLSSAKALGKDELRRQTQEIILDKENLHVRRSLINSEIAEINNKIKALDSIRGSLEQDLLKLHEDELELDDELEGVQERIEFEEAAFRQSDNTKTAPAPHVAPSRRRRGPVFLPSEHDELPPGVAFMTLESHLTPIAALDFSEPYGTLVSTSQADSQPRLWDLMTGSEIGRLRGHRGAVKCIQVEDNLCLTGAEDGSVRLWDLRLVDEEEWERSGLADVAEEDEGAAYDGELVEKPNGIRSNEPSEAGTADQAGPCIRLFEGHSKAVTALYFEDECLVTGASDKTLRQWDLATGQCVMTMDILWAISHPQSTITGAGIPNHTFPSAAASAGHFAVPTPPSADGSWDMYEDFVGGVQFWGYGLVSGSGDGAVRMWDMRTGQAHRTLMGHTGPVTCLQFDEMHIASGSLDKSIRIWDVRTGGTFETLKYDHAVTALQFDTRKVIAATGENNVKIYNRTSMQHSSLSTNGHTQPVERLRYMDRYLVSGGRDAAVKIWTL
ncbi:WD40-repeat-containing domain protein [Suillus fuscotomentosus]|uniref:WD40-repeat-containing domain protein n=1 Tax=Suillus fuscotomentosus TaxID=1912939 RepID=A0AAD4HW39_9AGAM|nr:WD40-repeat-containing domain protein [Suillus fuscotomentosus]KAG1908534.1 WD40-repeat-containing domain protein [Suillus fuscotomentosus]